MPTTERRPSGTYRASSPSSGLRAGTRKTSDLGWSGSAKPSAAEPDGVRAHSGAESLSTTVGASRTPTPSRAMPAAESVISELVSVYAEAAETEMPPWRMDMIHAQIRRTGGYEHFPGELIWGARVAWRNRAGCVGMEYWRALRVQDSRDRRDAHAIFRAMLDFLGNTFNGGDVSPAMIVFGSNRPRRPGPRILNHQLVGYAGHLLGDGSILGDAANVGLTRAAAALGWRVERRTAFDVLPVMIQTGTAPPELFTLPDCVVPEVPIIHPHLPIERLGLRCIAFPALASMRLEIGGLTYPAAPFSRPYACGEVALRIMAAGNTPNALASVAQVMGLATDSDRRLWREPARVELVTAVRHSFATAGVKLIDHEGFCPHSVSPAAGTGEVPADQRVGETNQTSSAACVLASPSPLPLVNEPPFGPRLVAQRTPK